MDERLQPLFTPWKIGNCEIKNRIVLTSMGGTDLFGWMEKNHFDKEGANFILNVALLMLCVFWISILSDKIRIFVFDKLFSKYFK